MDFTIHRDELRKALDIASLALKESAKDPILTHFLVEIDVDGNALLKANNNFLYCVAEMDTLKSTEGKMTLPGSQLKEIAKAVETGPIHFELGEDESVTVTAGQAKLRLSALSPEEFLAPKGVAADATFEKYSVSHLTEALKFMKVYVGTDKDRPQYEITHLRNGHWMASDGCKIGMFEREGFSGDVVIQTQALNSVLAFLKASSADEVIVSCTEQFCWLNDGKNRMAFRRDNRTFPNVIEAVLEEAEPQDHLSVNRDFMEQVVQRLKITLDGGNTRMEVSISGDDAGAIKIQTTNSRGKVSEESFPVQRLKGAGEDVVFAIDWRPLLATLQADPFSDGVVDFFYLPQKQLVKFVKDTEGSRAVALIALRD